MADPYTDFDTWDADRFEYEKSRPKCYYCEEPIYDDEYFEHDSRILCRECFDRKFKDWTRDDEIECPVCGKEFDDSCYRIDGEVICEDCMEDTYKIDID